MSADAHRPVVSQVVVYQLEQSMGWVVCVPENTVLGVFQKYVRANDPLRSLDAPCSILFSARVVLQYFPEILLVRMLLTSLL